MKKLFFNIKLLSLLIVMLTGCNQPDLNVNIVKHLRDENSGVAILSAKITKEIPLKNKYTQYSIEGEYQYINGRYQYAGQFNNISLYRKLNHDERISYSASLIAQHSNNGWHIESETFPKLQYFRNGKGELTHSQLFDESKRLENGVYLNPIYGQFLYNDAHFNTLVHVFIDQLIEDGKKIKSLQKIIEKGESAQIILKERLVTQEKNEIQKITENIRAEYIEERTRFMNAEGLKNLDPELEEFFERRRSEVTNEVVSEVQKKYEHHPSEVKLQDKIDKFKVDLTERLEKLPNFNYLTTQCNNKNYLLYGDLCEKLFEIKAKYLD